MRCAADREQHFHHVVGRIIGIGDRRTVIALEIHRLTLLMKHNQALGFLRRFDRAQRLGHRRFRQPAEILLDDRHRLGRLHVANDRDDHVRRHIIFLEKRSRIGSGECFQIGRITDGRLAIRMRGERCRQKLFDDASDRIALGAHAPFLGHHIALFVELPEDRMQKTLRLEIRPQLETI